MMDNGAQSVMTSLMTEMLQWHAAKCGCREEVGFKGLLLGKGLGPSGWTTYLVLELNQTSNSVHFEDGGRITVATKKMWGSAAHHLMVMQKMMMQQNARGFAQQARMVFWPADRTNRVIRVRQGRTHHLGVCTFLNASVNVDTWD
jgi:hypothetical protein